MFAGKAAALCRTAVAFLPQLEAGRFLMEIIPQMGGGVSKERTMARSKTAAFLLENGFPFAFASAIAYGLKYHYSRACAEDLSWILSPTAWVVQLLTGINLEVEQSIGYIDRESAVAVVSACAGVNFMIAAFLLLCCSTVCRLEGTGRKLMGIAVSAAMAYLAAIAANAVRIAAIVLVKSSALAEWATVEWIHRTGGALVYFAFLLVLCPVGWKTAEFLGGRTQPPEEIRPPGCARRHTGASAALLPLSCYLSIAIGIPLANGAWHRDATKFINHCTQVASVCLVLLAVYFAVVFIRRRFSVKGGRGIRRLSAPDSPV